MEKDEFDIEVLDDALVVGEKRFERERTEGRGQYPRPERSPGCSPGRH
jgi:hypothetical protein